MADAGPRRVVSEQLRVLALEPYYGGSHRAVLDGLAGRIDAEWTPLTLPARKWKWRMRGAAITMAPQARDLARERAAADAEAGISARAPFDVIFASTFVNLAEFRGMVGAEVAGVPAIVYFHENQLVYPNRHTAEWDFQFPLTNITSALSADCCVFNTAWNCDRFCDEIPGFLREFPDHHPKGVAESIRAKSRVIAPPFDPAPFDAVPPSRGPVPRIVWPHRWEHDKDPDAFFSAVAKLAEEGLDFEVAVAGQMFRDVPDSILAAEAALGSRLVHLGAPESIDAYARLLASCDISVSTAINEFFGIAMVESAYAGCYPVVPDRLAYPELYPREMRYTGPDALVAMLRSLVLEPPAPGAARQIAQRFTFEALIGEYESVLHAVARGDVPMTESESTMTDEPTQPDENLESQAEPEMGAPTPEELLAETQEGDPEVGADGTGMGELP
jgi:glycosyltransferase involved in cell wall biosynthesis